MSPSVAQFTEVVYGYTGPCDVTAAREGLAWLRERYRTETPRLGCGVPHGCCNLTCWARLFSRPASVGVRLRLLSRSAEGRCKDLMIMLGHDCGFAAAPTADLRQESSP